MKTIGKPLEGEYAPYAIMYIKLVPDDGFVLTHMRKNFEEIRSLILSLPKEKLVYRYAPDKWTIKDILVHIIDDERIFAYRALRFARNDVTELPGFEQDDYARVAGAGERSLASIFEEYESVRSSTIAMFNSFDEEALKRSGIANGNRMSVRGTLYHLAGHELHHLNIIKERYLGSTTY